MNEASTSSSEADFPLWTKAQCEALAALNIPVWQPKAAPAVADKNSSSYFYKLKNWLLISTEPLPVQLPTWLQDVFRTLAPTVEQRPTEVSASTVEHSADLLQLNLPETLNAELSATQKRDLWTRISALHD
ncbi:hypothetical protein [Pseudidiomarina terrestris]|uniref:hypothetical protein n=1 Tax=Pseudidiomarina terrestris TaxID=2820060 RepID=UPI00265512C1|nr:MULTISPECIES: hypothetical protein [unclassified Pseudidiomarina]MDN7136595.1 hypothetical protein [Pseudidiomarina sp. 1ASP75-5]MDN7138891.1 hypothetical protein [Pseudidiomarina sp. 1ASP75-14]